MQQICEFVSYARSLVGTPFRHQGRVPGVGVDCIGVVILAAQSVGWLPMDFVITGYSREPVDNQLEDGLANYLIPDKAGCVGLFRLLREPQHVAVIDWFSGTMIHAWSPNGKVVEHSLDRFWSKRIVRTYQWLN